MQTFITTIMTACVALLLPMTTLHAQEAMSARPTDPEPEPVSYAPATPLLWLGVGGGLQLSMHSASNMTLPQAPTCCSGYDGTSKAGIAFGIEGGLPVGTNLSILARLSFAPSGATMRKDEATTVRVGSQAVTTALRHTLVTSMTALMLEPAVEYRINSRFGLMGGLRLGTLTGVTYDQKEELADPTLPYDYGTGGTTFNASSGDVRDVNALQFGIVVGARYWMSLNAVGTLALVPEVTYAPMFTDVAKNVPWSVSAFRAGISVLYTIMTTPGNNDPLRPGR